MATGFAREAKSEQARSVSGGGEGDKPPSSIRNTSSAVPIRSGADLSGSNGKRRPSFFRDRIMAAADRDRTVAVGSANAPDGIRGVRPSINVVDQA